MGVQAVIKISNRSTWAALASLAVLSSAAIGGVAIAQNGPAPKQCGVTIDRSADPSSFGLVRQEFKNGSCICAVTTGPLDQSESVEKRIASLVESRTCADATSVAMPGQGAGLSGAVIGGVAGIVAAVGLVSALDDDEPQPVSP
jgi:hypothetical protein